MGAQRTQNIPSNSYKQSTKVYSLYLNTYSIARVSKGCDTGERIDTSFKRTENSETYPADTNKTTGL